MDQLFTDRQLLFNIIMNTDIEDLYLLYQTNHQIRNFLNEKYTMTKLSEKYHTNYLDYEEGYYDFFNLVWDVVVDKIGFENQNTYLREEIIRAAAVIDRRYLNAGDKMTSCDYTSSYLKEHTEWICRASLFLKKHGFNDLIQKIFVDIDNTYNIKERNILYEKWLKLLKIKALTYLNNDTLLDKPFTTYTIGMIED